MTTLSTRLGLKKATTADQFHIQDYADNWAVLDDYPGVHPCTSASRPTTWAAGQAGMLIIETDTGLLWRWDGTGWQRQQGKGFLDEVVRTTDISTASTALVVALSKTVDVPAGNRRLLLVVEAPGVYNTVGLTRIALFRGATQLQTGLHQGRLAATYDAQPRALDRVTFDQPGSGSVTYTVQFSAEVGFGGTSTIQAGTNSPFALRVAEL